MFTSKSTSPDRRSRRSMVLARGGMVCSSQPLASIAGIDVLRRGGNAVDAAVAAAAVLGVVEPYSTGIGGDCFLLAWKADEHKLYGLNGSGRAPFAATLDGMRQRGHDEMPSHGILAVTVPGAVDAWCTALERLGTLTIADVLAPAIEYAAHGFPVSEIIAQQWGFTTALLQTEDGVRTFTIDGEPPSVGTIMRLPQLADTMRRIAAGGAEAFYRGELAERIAAFSRTHGGLLQLEDLAEHHSSWVEPISTDYRGYDVFELPPNGQGITALMALNILENFDVASYGAHAIEPIHLRIESLKLAFADRNRYIADPDHVTVPVDALLSKDYAQGRAALIRLDRTLKSARPGVFAKGTDTIYLTTADAAGNVVSFINSLYGPFGSGMVVEGTGITLQNRGYGFSLDPEHPNCIAAGKRPFHTIIPAMLFHTGRPLVSFGVMGGEMQSQGHVQLVSNLVDFGTNIQEAIDLPRFHYLDNDRVALEDPLAARAGAGLTALGHVVEDEWAALARGGFGGAQGIMIDPATDVYWGGSDWRKDGCAIGF